MNKPLRIILGVLILALIVLAGMGVFKSKGTKAAEAEIVAFAECLKDQGAVFYGAFWCPHCQNQHRLFGKKGSEALPYVECSTPDGQGQTEACKEAGIESYPTWRFADGSEVGGTQSIQDLSAKTSCPISPLLAEFYDIPSEEVGENEEETVEISEVPE